MNKRTIKCFLKFIIHHKKPTIYLKMMDQNITSPNLVTVFVTYSTKVSIHTENSRYLILLGKVNKKITKIEDYIWFPAC